MIELTVNGQLHQVDVEPDTPLLWVIREALGLTGTRFGCGEGQCGACTVHINGSPTRSCILPAVAMAGAEITTIEALAHKELQAAWIEHQVPQCGWCQSGQLMQAAGLLASKPRPSDDDIDQWMSNICRCGTYMRIRAAIHTAASRIPLPEPEPAEPPAEPQGDVEEGGDQ